MSKTTHKELPKVPKCVVRILLDDKRQHVSRWAEAEEISPKVVCAAQTLNE